MTIRPLPEVRAFKESDAIAWDMPHEAVEAFDQAHDVRAVDEASDTVISLYGVIGYDPFTETDNSERRVSAALRKIGKRDVTVNINSPGGSFFSGITIYNLLRTHPNKVTVNVLGMAGSAASVIAMAGDAILMAQGASLMVHNAAAMVAGNKYDCRDAAELLGEVDAAMAEIYAARSGVAQADVSAWMDRRRGDGTVFNARSAVDHGLADGMLAESAIRIAADATKSVPAERAVERALMAAGHKTRAESRSIIAEMKGGKPDAATHAKPDAGEALTASAGRCLATLTTKKAIP